MNPRSRRPTSTARAPRTRAAQAEVRQGRSSFSPPRWREVSGPCSRHTAALACPGARPARNVLPIRPHLDGWNPALRPCSVQRPGTSMADSANSSASSSPTAARSPSASSAPAPSWASAPSASTRKEDRFALHRFKADEAYPLGERRRADPGLPRHRRHRRHRQAPRRRRHPPRLRLPLRERRLRPRLRGGRHRLRRPAAASARACWATRSPPARIAQAAGRPGRARHRRAAAPTPTPPRAWRREHRLPGHRQGLLRRRRPRHARLPQRAPSCASRSTQAAREAAAAFGARRGLPREVHRAPQAHRGAAPRRPPRQPRPPLRARLLGPAPPPEGRRDRPRAQPRRPSCATRLCDAAVAPRPRRRLRQRRHRRVPGRRAAARTTSSR